MVTRRQMLRLAGAATLLALPAARASAAAAPGGAGSASTARIAMDWHSHFVTHAEVEFLRRRRRAPRVFTGPDGKSLMESVTTVSAAAGKPAEFTPSDIAFRLRQLDANGVSRQLLTHTVAMGLDATLPVAELRTLFRAVNDELAATVRAHPGRFSAVAAVPTADPKWAATELRRAHRELGLIGASLPLNAFASLASARTLAPLFAEAQQQGSHIFVHRGPVSSALPDQPPLILPQDTEYARWTLISNSHLAAGGITLTLTDFLDPYPDVTVEVVMLAGFLPYLTDSVIPAARQAGIKDPLERLRRIYYDTGPYSRIGGWVAQAARALGADRILFGTDFGVGGGARGDIGPSVATLDGVLAAEQRQAIYVDNSRELLRRHGVG